VNTSGGRRGDAGPAQGAHSRASPRAVLDVWEHEPGIDAALLAEALIATPHIAGYSLTEGECRPDHVRGPVGLFRTRLHWPAPASLPPPRCPKSLSGQEGGKKTSCAAFSHDAMTLRKMCAVESDGDHGNGREGSGVQAFPAEYPVRREFTATVSGAVNRSMRSARHSRAWFRCGPKQRTIIHDCKRPS